MKYYVLALVAFSLAFYSCSEDDTNPQGRITTISRLYVSFEEYDSNNEAATEANIHIMKRADTLAFVLDSTHLSMARGGGAIYFNPFIKAIMLASANQDTVQNDSAIYVTAINDRGLLNNGGFMYSRFLKKVRGFAYHRASDALLVVNNDSLNSGIFIIDRPTSITQTRKPWRQLFTGALNMWGAAYRDNRLFVSKQGENGGIYVFDNIMTTRVSTVDSTANIAPARTLSIANARNLHGMAYDTVKNVLAITDFGDGTTVGTGRILIFEDFGSMANASTITPTRIITGVSTQLTKPVDVAIDARASGQYIYVADKSKKILRFRLSDNGNVEPAGVFPTVNTPAGLTLDARDDSTLPQF